MRKIKTDNRSTRRTRAAIEGALLSLDMRLCFSAQGDEERQLSYITDAFSVSDKVKVGYDRFRCLSDSDPASDTCASRASQTAPYLSKKRLKIRNNQNIMGLLRSEAETRIRNEDKKI